MKRLVLVGYPVGHSLSPVMHNAALKAMGLESKYQYDVQSTLEHELHTFVKSMQEGRIAGANITIPYKTEIMNYLSVISDEAVMVGSVNTLYRAGDAVAGCNTDVVGFLESLRENDVSLKGIHATILGAGGAAKAVGHALVKEGAALLDIVNRTTSNAKYMVSRLNNPETCEVRIWPTGTNELDLRKTDLLVNCTPIGMIGHSVTESPVTRDVLHRDMVVMDLVYNPRITKLLQESKQAGCRIIDGTGMLVHQGAAALEIWIKEKPPIEIMRNAIVDGLGGG